MLVLAQDGRNAYGLLYLAAVLGALCGEERCQGRVDIISAYDPLLSQDVSLRFDRLIRHRACGALYRQDLHT